MATNVPEPVNTANGPTYEGRVLDRPADEVVDQGINFDLGTLMSRRLFIGAGVAGFGSLALVACSSGSSNDSNAKAASTSSTATSSTTSQASTSTLPSGEIPDETAGPYPGDGSNGPDVLQESGIVRSDIRTSIGATEQVEGVPLEFTLNILDMNNNDAPFEGAAVYAWHCNALGEYSMYSEGVEDETWLRGVQVADADGKVTFKSIMPGCYTGRWPHIHFEVYENLDETDDSNNAISVSQLALPEDSVTPIYELDTYKGSAENLSQLTLATDNVFGEDEGELQLATVTGDVNSGYTAELTVRVDTTTEPEMQGGGPGGPGGPGGAPSGGAPGGQPPMSNPGSSQQPTA